MDLFTKILIKFINNDNKLIIRNIFYNYSNYSNYSNYFNYFNYFIFIMGDMYGF